MTEANEENTTSASAESVTAERTASDTTDLLNRFDDTLKALITLMPAGKTQTELGYAQIGLALVRTLLGR